MAAESKIARKNAGSVHGVLVNEGREKKFNFPARGIGLLCRFQPPDSIVEICRAIGTVYVRSDVPLILKIQGPSADAAIDTPSFFSLIDPSEFLGLMLVGFSDETRTNPSLRDRTEKNMRAIANTLIGWSRLELLAIDNVPIDSATVASFNKFKHLRHLRLTRCMLDAPNLAQQPFLHLLKTLYIVDIKNIDATVRSVAKSEGLEYIYLARTGVSADAISELKNCSKLAFVYIREKTFSDAMVAAIISLNSITKVGFDGTLTHRQIETLIKCNHLRVIGLASNCYPTDEKNNLKSISGKIDFISPPTIDITGGGSFKMPFLHEGR
jgi:hypothetical protein